MAHDHAHIDLNAGDRRITLAIAVNAGLTLLQLIGGLISGSLALIADALHNLSDALSLALAFGARKWARRPASAQMPFGHGKIETIAALINYVTLILLGLWLIHSGIERFMDPQPINGWIIILLAAVALVVDVITAAMTFRLAKDSANIRAAFLHNVADAMGSVAVIIAGIAMIALGWSWIDPLVTLLIAGYILWLTVGEIGSVIKSLMLGAPDDIAAQDVIAAVQAVPGVAELHNVRLWQLREGKAAFDAHLALTVDGWADAVRVRDQAKQVLADQFSITDTTLELEPDGACENPAPFGYGSAGDEHTQGEPDIHQ